MQPTLFATGTPLASQTFVASGNSLAIALGFAPTLGEQLTVVTNTATPAASNPIVGSFSDLTPGGTIAQVFSELLTSSKRATRAATGTTWC